MNNSMPPAPAPESPAPKISVKIFGVGSAGVSVLEQIAQQNGFDVRFTGPWPPYSFVNI